MGLTKLVDYLADTARIRVSTETARQVLREASVPWQATKTWKASKDPDFVAKKDRILDLYDHPPAQSASRSIHARTTRRGRGC